MLSNIFSRSKLTNCPVRVWTLSSTFPSRKSCWETRSQDQQLNIFIRFVGKINDSIKMQYTLSAPQQRSACSLVTDTLRGLRAAACFCQQTFSHIQCLLGLQALSKQTKTFITHRKDLNAHFFFLWHLWQIWSIGSIVVTHWVQSESGWAPSSF